VRYAACWRVQTLKKLTWMMRPCLVQGWVDHSRWRRCRPGGSTRLGRQATLCSTRLAESGHHFAASICGGRTALWGHPTYRGWSLPSTSLAAPSSPCGPGLTVFLPCSRPWPDALLAPCVTKRMVRASYCASSDVTVGHATGLQPHVLHCRSCLQYSRHASQASKQRNCCLSPSITAGDDQVW